MEIYETLRFKILNNILLPGEKLSEIPLAREFSCSRTPVRDALKRLQVDGLVSVIPKSGTYVRQIEKNQTIEIIQMRASFERLAFILICQNPKKNEIESLQKIKDNIDKIISKSLIDMTLCSIEHFNFHKQLIQLSHNDLLIKSFNNLNLKNNQMFYIPMSKDKALQTQEEHQRIINLLQKGDISGAQFIEEHLLAKIKRFYPDESIIRIP